MVQKKKRRLSTSFLFLVARFPCPDFEPRYLKTAEQMIAEREARSAGKATTAETSGEVDRRANRGRRGAKNRL